MNLPLQNDAAHRYAKPALEVSGNCWNGRMYDGANQGICTDTENIEADRWYHLAYVYDNTNNYSALYVDGELKSSSTAPNTPAHEESCTIGNHGSANAAFIGIIDEIGYFKRRLSDSEIKGMYDMGKE